MDEVAMGIDFYDNFKGNTAKSKDWITGVLKDMQTKQDDSLADFLRVIREKTTEIGKCKL